MTQELFVVEDSDDDFESLERTCRSVGFPGLISRFADAELALVQLRGRERAGTNPARMPSLILLDLNLPGMDGRELLKTLKTDPALAPVPVVVFTTSTNEDDVRFCYQHHANAYQMKPMSLGEMEADITTLLTYWMDTVVRAPPLLTSKVR